MVYLFAGKFIYSVYIFRLVYQLEDTSTAKTHTHTKPKLLNHKKKVLILNFGKLSLNTILGQLKGERILHSLCVLPGHSAQFKLHIFFFWLKKTNVQ